MGIRGFVFMNLPSSPACATLVLKTQAQPVPSPAKLHLLREHDKHRRWDALTDKRVCLLCGAEFTGEQIRVRARNGKPVFECPEAGCPAELPHFVYAGNPLLSDATWSDWMRLESTCERRD